MEGQESKLFKFYCSEWGRFSTTEYYAVCNSVEGLWLKNTPSHVRLWTPPPGNPLLCANAGAAPAVGRTLIKWHKSPVHNGETNYEGQSSISYSENRIQADRVYRAAKQNTGRGGLQSCQQNTGRQGLYNCKQNTGIKGMYDCKHVSTMPYIWRSKSTSKSGNKHQSSGGVSDEFRPNSVPLRDSHVSLEILHESKHYTKIRLLTQNTPRLVRDLMSWETFCGTFKSCHSSGS